MSLVLGLFLVVHYLHKLSTRTKTKRTKSNRIGLIKTQQNTTNRAARMNWFQNSILKLRKRRGSVKMHKVAKVNQSQNSRLKKRKRHGLKQTNYQLKRIIQRKQYTNPEEQKQQMLFWFFLMMRLSRCTSRLATRVWMMITMLKKSKIGSTTIKLNTIK